MSLDENVKQRAQEYLRRCLDQWKPGTELDLSGETELWYLAQSQVAAYSKPSQLDELGKIIEQWKQMITKNGKVCIVDYACGDALRSIRVAQILGMTNTPKTLERLILIDESDEMLAVARNNAKEGSILAVSQRCNLALEKNIFRNRLTEYRDSKKLHTFFGHTKKLHTFFGHTIGNFEDPPGAKKFDGPIDILQRIASNMKKKKEYLLLEWLAQDRKELYESGEEFRRKCLEFMGIPSDLIGNHQVDDTNPEWYKMKFEALEDIVLGDGIPKGTVIIATKSRRFSDNEIFFICKKAGLYPIPVNYKVRYGTGGETDYEMDHKAAFDSMINHPSTLDNTSTPTPEQSLRVTTSFYIEEGKSKYALLVKKFDPVARKIKRVVTSMAAITLVGISLTYSYTKESAQYLGCTDGIIKGAAIHCYTGGQERTIFVDEIAAKRKAGENVEIETEDHLKLRVEFHDRSAISKLDELILFYNQSKEKVLSHSQEPCDKYHVIGCTKNPKVINRMMGLMRQYEQAGLSRFMFINQLMVAAYEAQENDRRILEIVDFFSRDDVLNIFSDTAKTEQNSEFLPNFLYAAASIGNSEIIKKALQIAELYVQNFLLLDDMSGYMYVEDNKIQYEDVKIGNRESMK